MSPEATRRTNPEPIRGNEQAADSPAVRTVIIQKLGTFTIPIKDQYDLWQDGLCRQTSQELFFPEKGEMATLAKKVCGRCPVQGQCLNYALEHDEYGIWGGLSKVQRSKLKGRKERVSTRRRAA